MKKYFILVLLALSFGNIVAQFPYKDGKELIKAMHAKYAPDKWYRYFTFSQDMEFYRNDSLIRKEVWHEAYQPGCLLIKFDTKDSKTGRLYENFKTHAYKAGQTPTVTPRVHELLLVGLDVYFFDPEKTIHVLDSLGYDLSFIHEGEFEGRKVYIVGQRPLKCGTVTNASDSTLNKIPTSRQFWIDAERLYMHRIVFENKGKVNDVVFGDYEKMDGNWIAKTITFKTDGHLGLIEHYYDILFPGILDKELFNPEKFNEVKLK